MQLSGEFELSASKERKQADADLRIALAMRGGVSLAVWIGGAVCEVEALRSASPESIYGRLRVLSNYERVEVDIMTGASAGGLNGAIYSASLMYGFPRCSRARTIFGPSSSRNSLPWWRADLTVIGPRRVSTCSSLPPASSPSLASSATQPTTDWSNPAAPRSSTSIIWETGADRSATSPTNPRR